MDGEGHAPTALHPVRPGSHSTGGWVRPLAGLGGCGKSLPHRNSTSEPSSLYRVAIPNIFNIVYLFTSCAYVYSKALVSHFTEFGTVSDHSNFISRLCLQLYQLLLTVHSYSDTNYITAYNYHVSFMGVAFSDFLNELAQRHLVFLSTSLAR